MKKALLVVLALMLLMSLLFVAPVLASPASKVNQKYVSATANWGIIDGDFYTDVYINPYQMTSKYPNQKLTTTGTRLSIFIVRSDMSDPMAEPTYIIMEDVEILDSDFSIDKKLTAAKLDVTVNVYNIELETMVDLTIYIEWTSTGSTMKYSDNWHFKSDDAIDNSHMSDASRDAMAVGSISITGFNGAFLNFAWLESMKQSQLMKYSQF